MVAFERYVTVVFPALRVMTVSSVPVKSTYSPRLETSRVVSMTTVPSITSPVKYEGRGSSTAISRGGDSPQIGMPHPTRNRAAAEEKGAMPEPATSDGRDEADAEGVGRRAAGSGGAIPRRRGGRRLGHVSELGAS